MLMLWHKHFLGPQKILIVFSCYPPACGLPNFFAELLRVCTNSKSSDYALMFKFQYSTHHIHSPSPHLTICPRCTRRPCFGPCFRKHSPLPPAINSPWHQQGYTTDVAVKNSAVAVRQFFLLVLPKWRFWCYFGRSYLPTDLAPLEILFVRTDTSLIKFIVL